MLCVEGIMFALILGYDACAPCCLVGTGDSGQVRMALPCGVGRLGLVLCVVAEAMVSWVGE